MRSKTPPYSSTELTESVDRLSKLTDLQARALTNYKIVQDERMKNAYKGSYDRLNRNVETAEIRLQKMQDSVAKWETENGGK